MVEFAFDGLVVVDPDCDLPINPDYIDNLHALVSICQELGKPVFLVELLGRTQNSKINQILANAYNVPIVTNDIWKQLLAHGQTNEEIREYSSQMPVDFIAQVIGEKPDVIKLGFGGIYVQACVYQCAASWCAEVDTNHKIIFRGYEPCKNPIRSGQVIDDIV